MPRLVRLGMASDAHCPQSSRPGLTRLSSPRGPSFVRGKRGPGSPTAPTMPHRRDAENYSSREAARGGPPTPRGLQSHVQASLVNSARARAAREQASGRNLPVRGAPGQPCWPLGYRPLPHPHASTPPTPLQPRVVQTRTSPGSPPPPPRPELRRGCIVAARLRPPARPGAPIPLAGIAHRQRGRRERKEANAGGGRTRGESHQHQAWPGLLQNHVGLFAITNVATRPPAADKSDQGRSGPPRSMGGESPDVARPKCRAAAAPAAKKGEPGRQRGPCVRTRAPARAGWPGAAIVGREWGEKEYTPTKPSYHFFLCFPEMLQRGHLLSGHHEILHSDRPPFSARAGSRGPPENARWKSE